MPPVNALSSICTTSRSGGTPQVRSARSMNSGKSGWARPLARLKGLGLQLAIDSFGTGSSSVANLAQLPLDEMKLTATLVSDMRRVPLHARIVRTLVQLAQNLGLRVTAEGVEDAETALALSTLGCGRVQGGYVGPPIGTLEVLARCGPAAGVEGGAGAT